MSGSDFEKRKRYLNRRAEAHMQAAEALFASVALTKNKQAISHIWVAEQLGIPPYIAYHIVSLFVQKNSFFMRGKNGSIKWKPYPALLLEIMEKNYAGQ